MEHYEIFPLGDQAVSLSFGNIIDKQVHRKLVAARNYILAGNFPRVTDAVLGYSSLTVTYDALDFPSSTQSKPLIKVISDILRTAIEEAKHEDHAQMLKRIPVCYEPEFSTDMDFVTRRLGLTREDVISLHVALRYDVYMIGFLPGFPYMAFVDSRLRVPRKEKPSARVAAGSVALAGEQTGIYPVDSPGGWSVIGRTPVPMFNKEEETPCFLEAGDVVEFYGISVDEFYAMQSGESWG